MWVCCLKWKAHDPHCPHRDAGPVVEPRDKLDRLTAALDVGLMNGGLGMPETDLMETDGSRIPENYCRLQTAHDDQTLTCHSCSAPAYRPDHSSIRPAGLICRSCCRPA